MWVHSHSFSPGHAGVLDCLAAVSTHSNRLPGQVEPETAPSGVVSALGVDDNGRPQVSLGAMSPDLRCQTCGHPITFHGSGKSRCRALGCECRKWRGPTLLASTTISLSAAATQIERSPSFVKKHAESLGGKLITLSDLGPSRSRKKVWRFYPDKLSVKYPRLMRRLEREGGR